MNSQFVLRSLLFSACFLSFFSSGAQIKPVLREKAHAPAKASKLWLFLLAGQSNMAGRGVVEPADTVPNARVLILNKEGNWEIGKDPIHFDRTYAGVGPGLSFGKAMAAAVDTSIYIGLVPCAVGGSSINSWLPSVNQRQPAKNYAEAVKRSKVAMQTGVLKGIIWHQGETDCSEKGIIGYDQKLTTVIAGFRNDLGDNKIPFVAGELPAFQTQQPDSSHRLVNNPYVEKINMAITSLKGKVLNYNVIKADSTEHKGDHLHFDSPSARLMGKRYALAMKKLLPVK